MSDPEPRSPLRISSEEFVFFQNQIASMCRLDVPLADGLASMAREVRSRRLRALVDQVLLDVQAGLPLSAAVRKFPRVFPDLYVGLIEAGEASGSLSAVLENLGEYSTSRHRIRQRIRVALAYPACLVVVIAVIMGILFWVWLPRFAYIHQALSITGVDLPRPTRVLLNISQFVQESGPVLLLGVLSAVFVLSLLARLPRVRVLGELVAMNLPLIGTVLRRSAWFLFCQTLALLLRAGVTPARSLDLMRQAFALGVLHSVCVDLHRAADNGERLSDEARRGGFFPETLVWKLAFGEQRGDLVATVEELARYYESEARIALDRSGVLVGPILIIVVGVFIGFCYFAIMMPILKLSETMRRK
ncbi:MAG: type II secretion system F family protein [Planctomycetota bacterium]